MDYFVFIQFNFGKDPVSLLGLVYTQADIFKNNHVRTHSFYPKHFPTHKNAEMLC